MNFERLRDIAMRFREVLECMPVSGRPIGLQKFPRGSCGDAALLLGTHLREQGFPHFNYMLGERRDPLGEDYTSHAWLERDGIIVDITADQFPDCEEKVLVVRNSSWHATFHSEKQNVADYRIYDKNTFATLDVFYKKFCLRLRET